MFTNVFTERYALVLSHMTPRRTQRTTLMHFNSCSSVFLPHTLTNTHAYTCVHISSSTLWAKHPVERTNKILPSFWGGNRAITSQHQPEQWATSCEMLAKCLLSSFICRHQSQTVVFRLAPVGLCFHVRHPRPQINWSIVVLFCQSDLFQQQLNATSNK